MSDENDHHALPGLSIDTYWMRLFALADELRRLQATFLGFFGLHPDECRYRIIASGTHWRLRAYADGGDGLPVLVVPAPIKPPYIWDISPMASVIRYGLAHGLRIYLIEWIPPQEGTDSGGLDEYAQAISDGSAHIAKHVGGPPFLMGHSLGGTLAAISAAREPTSIRGLVLLGSPLCFRPGASRFGDALVAALPPGLSGHATVPGSLISQLSVLASPETFIWARLTDAALSAGDPAAAELHTRIERWSLDEVPLSGRLVGQIGQWLYREDRFCREALVVRHRTIGPSCLHVPTLGVLNTSDDVATTDSMTHFLNAVPGRNVRTIFYPGEIGVGFQHVALLVGRKARATVWPAITSWMASTAEESAD